VSRTDPVATAVEAARSSGVDLIDCDREPIHVPGAVQPHGALVAMAEPALVVTVASENTGDILGVTVDELLGSPVDATLGADVSDALFDAAALDDVTTANPLSLAGPGDRRLEVALHRSDGLLVAEFEPERAASGAGRLYRRLRVGLDRLQTARSQQTVCDTLADVVAELTGLDRVMVYRFAEDDHGEVVAEVVRPDWPPYLGLHYPASDIPAQARALYVRNRLRVIARRDYTPSPLRPVDNPVTGRPLDLSDAVLRSVSPIHLEYLRNMGVEASMSLSLVRGDRLWGLVACHHGGAIHLPFDLRAACELLAQAASAQLGSVLQLEASERRERAVTRTSELLRQAATADDPLVALVSDAVTLRDVVDCAGAAVVAGDRCLTVGRTPDEDAVQALVEALPPTGPGEVVARTSIVGLVDGLDTGGAAGVLAVPLSERSGTWLVWFRDEVVHEIRWGGDPAKAVTDTAGQLRPRASFAQWREEVHGQSRRWTPADRAAVEHLWRGLTEVVVAGAVRLEQSNRELSRRNVELDAFAFTASHDLKAPLHAIASDAELLRADHAADLGPDGLARLDAIGRQTQRLTNQIETLLAYGRVGHRELEVGRVPLSEVVDDVIDAQRFQIAERGARVTRVAELPVVDGDAALLGQLFDNLVANALTYTDAATPTVEIGPPTAAERAALDVDAREDHEVVTVRDNGPGVPAEERIRIFDVFRRAPGAERFASGSGVGLATARRIAERHGGTVAVVDGGLGGATFCVLLAGVADE
jgi:chemotaxis family two-component system sensor kinase Cph1